MSKESYKNSIVRFKDIDITFEFGKMPNYDREYPMSDKFVQQSLTIPNNPFMTDSEVQQVIDTVLNMFVAPLSK